MDYDKMMGLGVAGNFTGHLEQAGEARDFVAVVTEDPEAPKGLFPFYVPAATGHFTEVYPLSATTIRRPAGGGDLQIEPEMALLCVVDYEGGRVVGVRPWAFGAYNDCSIRTATAHKISEKKNWGRDSKGLAAKLIELDQFEPGGILDSYRLGCYLWRDGALQAYGVDSAVTGYRYFYEQLIVWTIAKMNGQKDEGPLEAIGDLLARAAYPEQLILSVGATRYTDYGATHYLQVADEAIVVVYDSDRYGVADIEALLLAGVADGEGVSILRQRVI